MMLARLPATSRLVATLLILGAAMFVACAQATDDGGEIASLGGAGGDGSDAAQDVVASGGMDGEDAEPGDDAGDGAAGGSGGGAGAGGSSGGAGGSGGSAGSGGGWGGSGGAGGDPGTPCGSISCGTWECVKTDILTTVTFESCCLQPDVCGLNSLGCLPIELAEQTLKLDCEIK